MEYRKEQEFIVAYDENNNSRGKWDIVNNTYIGVRGNPIKSIPTAFKVGYTDIPTYIGNALELIHNNNNYWHNYNITRGQRLEQLISLQLIVSLDWRSWDFIESDKTRLTKDVVSYLKENCQGIYNEANIAEYKMFKKYNALMNKHSEHRQWISSVLREVEKHEIPTHFIEGMINRGIHEKVFFDMPGWDFAHMLKNWASMIKDMEDTLEVKPNIKTNFTILQYLHNEWKMGRYDENLNKYNNLDMLYYENDQYIVRPLISRKEFHEEAEAQHNCVERLYMETVAQGKTHVVVVRKKNAPNTSYITCEISNHGVICQYLRACNQPPKNNSDIAFRDELQYHLHEVFTK